MKSRWRSLNGVVGDSLAEIRQQAGPADAAAPRRRQTLTLEKRALAEQLPEATGRIVVLVHGLCMSDLQWRRQNHDHGAALARDLGYTPVYLSYNSGLHISANGRNFAALLEDLLAAWPAPVEDLVLIGHSMGGLVIRSACACAEAGKTRLAAAGSANWFFSERRTMARRWSGSAIGSKPSSSKFPSRSAFVKPGRARSAGITDLRYGALLDEDWQGRDRFAQGDDPRKPVPLPEGVACYAIAATLALAAGGVQDRWLGDGLVPVDSALGRHKDLARTLGFPDDHQFIACGVRHLDLLRRKSVYDQIVRWLAPLEPRLSHAPGRRKTRGWP